MQFQWEHNAHAAPVFSDDSPSCMLIRLRALETVQRQSLPMSAVATAGRTVREHAKEPRQAETRIITVFVVSLDPWRFMIRQSLRLVFLFLLALSATAAIDSSTQQAGDIELIQKAERELAADQPRAAMIILMNAAPGDPDSAAVRQLLATTSIALGDGARGEKEINKAMELGLDAAVGWPVLIKALFAQGDMDRVIDSVYQMPPDTPVKERADLLGMRGYAEAANYQWSQAEKTLRSALSIAPDSLPAMVGMAVLNGRRAEYEDARQWVERALDLHPDAPDAWILLGDLELALGNYASAEVAIRNAIARRHFIGLEHARHALALAQLGRYDDARAAFAVLREANLTGPCSALYVAGRVYFAQQLYQPAAEAFDAAYAADARFLANRLYLGHQPDSARATRAGADSCAVLRQPHRGIADADGHRRHPLLCGAAARCRIRCLAVPGGKRGAAGCLRPGAGRRHDPPACWRALTFRMQGRAAVPCAAASRARAVTPEAQDLAEIATPSVAWPPWTTTRATCWRGWPRCKKASSMTP